MADNYNGYQNRTNLDTDTNNETVSDIVTVNGMDFAISKLDVGLNHIQFTTNELSIYNALDTFKSVESISIMKSNTTEPYATYENLMFTSATISADESVTITMSILSYADIKMKEAEKLQSNIEEIVSKLVYGEDIQSNENMVNLASKVIRGRIDRGEDFDSVIKDYPKMRETERKCVREKCFGHK